MLSSEVVLFVAAALVAGGLTMGGVTLVYFLDKWRADPSASTAGETRPHDPDLIHGDPRDDSRDAKPDRPASRVPC